MDMQAASAAYAETPLASPLRVAAVGRGAELTLRLSGAAIVVVKIRNLDGREVVSLPATPCGAGAGTLRWDGCGSHGAPLPEGCYFAEILGVNAAGESSSCLVALQH